MKPLIFDIFEPLIPIDFAAPPTYWFNGTALLTALTACYIAAFQGRVDLIWYGLLIVLDYIVTTLWLVKFTAYLKAKRSVKNESVPRKSIRQRFIVFPALALGTVSLIACDIPFKAAFALSQPALNALIAKGRSVPQNNGLPDQRVGFYMARNITKHGEGLRFLVATNDLSDDPDWLFYYYPPNLKTPTDYFVYLEEISDGWYQGRRISD